MNDQTVLIYNYEQKTKGIIAFALSTSITYVLSKQIIPTMLIGLIAASVSLLLIKKRRIIFKKEMIEVYRGFSKRKNFIVPYSSLTEVCIEQILTTTYVNIVFKFFFEVNGRRIQTNLDIDQKVEARKLFNWLKKKGIRCQIEDDFLFL